MIRIGAYDAYDKWEILCKYWEDKAAPQPPILDKRNSPALPSWERLALLGGLGDITDYVQARLSWLRELRTGGIDYPPIANELAQFADQLGTAEISQFVQDFGSRITEGYVSSSEITLSTQLMERLRDVFKTGALRLLQWSDMTGEVPSIEIVQMRASTPFPVSATQLKKKALSLYCAMNYGRSDTIHIYNAQPEHATLVDLDCNALQDMQLIYPKDWTFACTDVEEFIAQLSGQQFDLIIADASLGRGRRRWDGNRVADPVMSWELAAATLEICSDTLIVNCAGEMFDELGVTADDLISSSREISAQIGINLTITELLDRDGGVYWGVIRKS